MKEKPRIVAVIPARSGSKGIPNKNIIDLSGKPLIAYTIEAALRSKSIHRLLTSTDDEKIAEIARLYGAEVPFIRPAELAKDDTSGLLVVQHAIRYIEENEDFKVDVVVILQPTSPLRLARHIDVTVEKLLRTGADSAVTVSPVRHHPSWCWYAEKDQLHPFSREGLSVSRRQDLPNIYGLNGAVYAVRRDVLFEQNSIFGRDVRGIIMPYEDSIDVDDYFDLFTAEMVLKHWKKWIHEKNKDR